MGKQPAERPTVLFRDPVTGDRIAVGEIITNTTIGIFHHSWKHPDARSRRDQVLKLTDNICERLDENQSPLMRAVYVHPQKGGGDEGTIPDPADALVDKLLDLASKKTKGLDGQPDSRVRLSQEQAEFNMRINIVTYSGSAEFVDRARERLTGGLIALGYNEEEIKKLFSQVLQLNLTPSFDTEKRGDLRFNEVNVVVDRDIVLASHFIGQPDTDTKYFAVVTPADRVTGAEDGRVTSDAYSVYMAVDGITKCPELNTFINNAMNAPRLEPDLRFQVPGITGRVFDAGMAFDFLNQYELRTAAAATTLGSESVLAAESITMPTDGYNTGMSVSSGTSWVERTGKTPLTIGNPEARVNPTSGGNARTLEKPQPPKPPTEGDAS
ncbi:MAG: hypothetical protein EB060_03300 [Proteobacteria bacterium]|nr:hypothetical protein [Pseudomonadota bacterium]